MALITGTQGPDRITGTEQDDDIFRCERSDTVYGLGGNDQARYQSG